MINSTHRKTEVVPVVLIGGLKVWAVSHQRTPPRVKAWVPSIGQPWTTPDGFVSGLDIGLDSGCHGWRLGNEPNAVFTGMTAG